MTDLEKEAIEFMKTNGHEVGNGDLVAQADEIAFDLSIKDELTSDGWIEFADDNDCEDDCKGWDGVESRCDCGNRRVYWTYDNCDFKDMQIYAMAD